MAEPLSFTWKGQNSLLDYGLYIKSFPDRIRPEERHTLVDIPGKSGSLIMTEGEDVYSSFDAEMTVLCKSNTPLDRIIQWLTGSSDFILSNDPDKARPARIANTVKFDTNGNATYIGTIPFLFQPFRQSRFPQQTDRVTITGASGSIVNPGDVASRPKISISGTGNNTITIGTMAMTFTGISGTIVVDCDAEIITKGGAIWTGSGTGSSGEFWKIPKGQVTITQTGSMSIVIDPGWRWF